MNESDIKQSKDFAYIDLDKQKFIQTDQEIDKQSEKSISDSFPLKNPNFRDEEKRDYTGDCLIENKVKSEIFIILFGLLLSSNAIYFGFGVALFNSFYKPFIQKVYNVFDEDEEIRIQTNLGFLFNIGGAFCSLTANLIYQKIGRYRSIILGYIIAIVLALISLIPSLYLLYFVRFAHGYLSCFYTFLCPLFINEIIIPKYKKIIANSFYFFLTLGILLSFNFGFQLCIDNWRLIFLFPVFFDLPKLLILVIFYRVESPVFLYEKYKETSADLKTILSKNYFLFYNEPELNRVIDNFIKERNKLAASSKIKVEFRDLFTRDYKNQIVFGFFLNLLNQATGINLLIFYSTKLYEQLKLENIQVLTILIGVFNLLSSIFSMIFNDKIGKKNPFIVGLIFQGIGLFLFGFGAEFSNSSSVVLGGYLFIFSFGISCGGLLYPYITDFVPPIGIPITALIQWGLAAVIVKGSIFAVNYFGELAIFLFCGCTAFIGSFLVWGMGVETSDKTQHQIFIEFKNKKFGKD